MPTPSLACRQKDADGFLTHGLTRLGLCCQLYHLQLVDLVLFFCVVLGVGGDVPQVLYIPGNTLQLDHTLNSIFLYDPFANHSFLVSEDFGT